MIIYCKIIFCKIIFCKNKRNLFVGFLDFEKAFDYVNRAQLLQDLMAEGCGTQYLHALSKMYMESFYIPKVSETQLGEELGVFMVLRKEEGPRPIISRLLSPICQSV